MKEFGSNLLRVTNRNATPMAPGQSDETTADQETIVRIRVLLASVVMAGAIGMLALITLYLLPLQAGAIYSVGMAVTWIAGDHVRRSSLRAVRASSPRTAARRKLRGTLRAEPGAVARPAAQVTEDQ